MAVEDLIAELADPRRPISTSKLTQLSDLGPTPLRSFMEMWRGLPEARRVDIASRLAGLGEDNVEMNFNALFRRLLNDESAPVRVQALGGLWECQERSLIDPLMRLMRQDPDEGVRAAATQALGPFALLAETGKLLPMDSERIAEALLGVIDNDEEALEVRRRAIEAIAPMGLPRVPEIIREAYESDVQELRVSALYAMGLSAGEEWVSILMDELENVDPQMRYEALAALGEIGEEETAERVGLLINDEDQMVQAAAINALGNIGGRAAKRMLEASLRHDDSAIAELAEAALSSLEFEEEPRTFRGYAAPPAGDARDPDM